MSKTSTKKPADISTRQKLQRYTLEQVAASKKGWRIEAKGDTLVVRR